MGLLYEMVVKKKNSAKLMLEYRRVNWQQDRQPATAASLERGSVEGNRQQRMELIQP
ncbi:hypothetical protein [Paenibacillus sp. NEAU-GSW1]|uniref:hypothetical protein n=1 Tax=Paenibacillus sp. NEAU-GSW1 TaxID=2682486 RepID=UPI0012E205EF|nr:hypothetical protein [Paenibacillus sp. NEAU-GSW1]MUT65983.1 hypothetical protein [Paenibacillus sp. NEAU-GSW1]